MRSMRVLFDAQVFPNSKRHYPIGGALELASPPCYTQGGLRLLTPAAAVFRYTLGGNFLELLTGA